MTHKHLVAIAARAGARKFGFFSVAFLVACGDPSGTNTPGTATSGGAPASGGTATTGGTATGGTGGSISALGGALSTGGSSPGAGGGGFFTGGTVNGGSGGSVPTTMGGSLTAGTGGSSAAGNSGSSGTSGGQAASGAAGQSAGGQSGGTSPTTGGKAGAGAGGVGGKAQAGSGGSAGANMAGRGGTSSGGQGGAGGKGTAGAGGSGSSGCKGGKVVHFVYFVEADQTLNEAHRNDIEKQAFAFQKYWFDQLGVTFYLNEPVVDVIKADHPASWYLTNPDGIHGSDDRWFRLGNVKNEVYRKLGISNFDPNHRVVNYPTTRHDGRVGGNFGGAWMDGDDMTCIATNGVNYPYDDRNPAHCLGHVAHEFGHVLGLDHEGPMTDCMQYGFYTGQSTGLCTFSAANVAKIKADADNVGWFKATPGQTCTAD
jgi:hypothetical protein